MSVYDPETTTSATGLEGLDGAGGRCRAGAA